MRPRKHRHPRRALLRVGPAALILYLLKDRRVLGGGVRRPALCGAVEFFNNQQLGHQAHKGSVISCELTLVEEPAPSRPRAATPYRPGPQRPVTGQWARPPLPTFRRAGELRSAAWLPPTPGLRLPRRFILLIKNQHGCFQGPSCGYDRLAWGRTGGTRPLTRAVHGPSHREATQHRAVPRRLPDRARH